MAGSVCDLMLCADRPDASSYDRVWITDDNTTRPTPQTARLIGSGVEKRFTEATI